MTISGRYDIDTLLEEVVTLPSIPTTVARINELLADPDCSLSTLAETIAADPSIAMKTLRLVNSAFYGLGQEVMTLEHAVALLGMKVIRNIAMTASVLDSIQGSTEMLLRHCVGCGVAMRVLVETGPLSEHFESKQEGFIFGLLHDIGKVIIDQYLPEESKAVRELALGEGIPWFKAEREIIGVDHAALGGRFAEEWKLSKDLVGAITGHHDLRQVEAEAHPLAAGLAVADFICGASGIPSYEKPAFELSEMMWAAAGLDNRAIPDILDRFFEEFGSIEDTLNMTG